jgi:hypothetical protein
MPKQLIHRPKLAGLITGVALCWLGSAHAQNLDSTVQVEAKINKDSAASQQRVSSLAQQTQDLLSEYRAVVREPA